jgi:thioredoxin reductase (NADPH)
MQIYDLIIIGGGPAGLSAALYACRFNLKVLLLEAKYLGGQAVNTYWIENYPGIVGISGIDLISAMEQQGKSLDLEIKYEEVKELQREGGHWEVITNQGKWKTLSIILAGGAQFRTLGVPGEKEWLGKGVSYCATCDGPFFKGKRVWVVGGGDSALEEALYLATLAEAVFVVHRREEFRASAILQKRLRENPKIQLFLSSQITEILGEQQVTGVKLKHIVTSEISEYPADAVFIYIGFDPQTQWLKGLLELDYLGYIKTDDNMNTSQRGIFAAGDIRQKSLRQVVTAAADGAIAAYSAWQYLDKI